MVSKMTVFMMRTILGVAIFARFCKSLRNYGATTTRKTGRVKAFDFGIAERRRREPRVFSERTLHDGAYLFPTDWNLCFSTRKPEPCLRYKEHFVKKLRWMF